MSRHNHSHCLHDLKYCEVCDVVYCTKCDREWGGHVHLPYTWYYYGEPYRVTWNTFGVSGDGGWELTNSSGQKVTDQSIISVFSMQPHTKEMNEIDCDTVCGHH